MELIVFRMIEFTIRLLVLAGRLLLLFCIRVLWPAVDLLGRLLVAATALAATKGEEWRTNKRRRIRARAAAAVLPGAPPAPRPAAPRPPRPAAPVAPPTPSPDESDWVDEGDDPWSNPGAE